MAVRLNRAIIVLYHRFCYIKGIRIYIVIWITYNNVATEITCLQKNMVALENLALTKNLDPLAPLRIWPLIVRLPSQLLKSSPQSHIFFKALPPFGSGGRGWGGGGQHSMMAFFFVNKPLWKHFSITWFLCFNRLFE